MEEQPTPIESFLREFRPLPPEPLPEPTSNSRVRRACAGIALVAAITASLWLATRRPTSMDRMLSGGSASLAGPAWLRLALEDPATFDAALTAASRQTLPGFDGSDSTLRVLAKQ